MSRIKLKQVDQISRKTVSDAFAGFMRHCQLKNLAPHTYTYYKKVRTLSGLLVHINRSRAELFRIRPEIGLRAPADQVRPFPRPTIFSRKQGQRGAKHGQTFFTLPQR